MWKRAQVIFVTLNVPGSNNDGLNGYTDLVRTLADLALHFQRPVLLINGDSHLHEADHPLADPTSATGVIQGTAAARVAGAASHRTLRRADARQ
jgi:hypothetical protein